MCDANTNFYHMQVTNYLYIQDQNTVIVFIIELQIERICSRQLQNWRMK